MRFFLKQKIIRINIWHKWFAWYPVKINYETDEYAIFEYVYRKIVFGKNNNILWIDYIQINKETTNYIEKQNLLY